MMPVERLPELNCSMARGWTRREGPLTGPLHSLSVLLHLIAAVERNATAVMESHDRAMPSILRLARRLAGPEADHLRAMSLDNALPAVWPDLAAAARA